MMTDKHIQVSSPVNAQSAFALRKEANSLIVPINAIVQGFNCNGLKIGADGVYAGLEPKIGYSIVDAWDGEHNIFIRSPHIGQLVDCIKVIEPEWFNQLNGQVIVDLGAGMSTYGYRFAQIVKAKAYIGVEGFGYSRLMKALKELQASEDSAKSLPAAVIGEDMLSALSRFPPNSISMLASSIDSSLFDGDSNQDTDGYLDLLGRAASEKLDPNGLLVNNLADIVPPSCKEVISKASDSLRKYSKIRLD